jgi:hypothetical protein
MAFSLPTFLFNDTLTASAMSAVTSCFTAIVDNEAGTPKSNGRAIAIVNYDSSGINFSRGISSVTRTAQGEYTIVFSNVCSEFTVESVSVKSQYQLGNAHDTTNENARVVYSMYYHTDTTSSVKVVHHNFRSVSREYHDPVSATAVFFDTDVTS